VDSPLIVLTRSALRRDRVIASVWIWILLITCYASAAATPGIYHSVGDRVSAAQAINDNPAVVALYGPILDVHSVGELSMTKMTALYAVFVALLFVVIFRRHTRLDEERGALELLGGTVAGRATPTSAAVVEGVLLSLVVGAGAALVNIVGKLPVEGSLVFGCAWAGTGLVAVGLAAIAAQCSSSARTCGGIAIGAVFTLYALRAFGDTGWVGLSWMSPFGWNTQLRAWSSPRWWVLLLYPLLTVGLLLAARVLEDRRDLGGGVLPSTPGRPEARPWLRSAPALAWRVQRFGLASWTLSVAVGGLVIGAIAPGVGKLLKGSGVQDMMQRLGGPGVIENTLLAAEFGILALAISGYAIGVVTHAADDERSGLAEEVRASPVSRTALWSSAALTVALGSLWLLVVTGTTAALGAGKSWTQMVGATLVQAPALAVTAALALLLWSIASRFAVAGWGVLAVFVVFGMVGELLKLPAWVIGFSPYTHVPKLPAEAMTWTSTWVLVVVAAGISLASWFAYRWRDAG
jgi:ABC-2 type transport system permease protein